MNDVADLQHVGVEFRDTIAEVVIRRPKQLNALNSQVLDELGQLFAWLQGHVPRCVIVTGDGGKAFVAGADISELNGLEPQAAEVFSAKGQEVFAQIERFPSPVIAAVNGLALGGGCELALACDIIYAAEHATFGQPEVKLGLIPGFGGSVRLARKIGPGAAREWIFSGEVFGAQRAKELGLVQEVFAADALMGEVRRLAGKIASRAPSAVRAAKWVMAEASAAPLPTASALERWRFGALFATDDMREGTTAFKEKRAPIFTGK